MARARDSLVVFFGLGLHQPGTHTRKALQPACSEGSSSGRQESYDKKRTDQAENEACIFIVTSFLLQGQRS